MRYSRHLLSFAVGVISAAFAPCRIHAPQAVVSVRRLWTGPKARHQQRWRRRKRRRLGFSEFSLPPSLALFSSVSVQVAYPVQQCSVGRIRNASYRRLLACVFRGRARHRRHSMHYPMRARLHSLRPSHTICSVRRLPCPSTLARWRRRLNELCVRTEGRSPL